MAENHPVGFRWVIDARERGATVIHVDPRFTRTSAMADLWVPLRAGTDTVFLGAMVNYVLDRRPRVPRLRRRLHERVGHRRRRLRRRGGSRRPVLGLGRRRAAATTSGRWAYARPSPPRTRPRQPRTADTPRNAGRQRHHHPGAARARPDARASALRLPDSASGTSPATRRRWSKTSAACRPTRSSRIADAFCRASGPDRTAAICYAVGWTQHSTGVQTIRTAAILQLLLGNIGRPGGGILALRGHASIQGSTDIPTLFDILPGYLPMPAVRRARRLARRLRREASQRTRLVVRPRSLHRLAAEGVVRRGRHRGERLRLRLAAADRPAITRISATGSTWPTRGDARRAVRHGTEPRGRRAERPARAPRAGEPASGWSSATWSRPRRRRSGSIRRRSSAASCAPTTSPPRSSSSRRPAHAEKDGCFTNTQRLLQWHDKAVDPPADARSEAWFVYHLGRRLKARAAAEAAIAIAACAR